MSFDMTPVWLTLKLAGSTTFILLLLGTPLAWWLANTHSRFKTVVSAVVSLPLVLPPTVLGFYLLLLMGPQGPLGELTHTLGLGYLPFTFTGLVIGSVIYSLPFVVQPIQNSFESINPRVLEVAQTLGAKPWDRFLTVVLPLSQSGFITATILGFAHTVGEFGVVLMLGGNIPGETKVLSVTIYEDVEALNYGHAHSLAAGLLFFSFVVLLIMHWSRRPIRLGR